MHVVGMFVGDQYRTELCRRHAEQRQAPLGLAQGEPAIDQDERATTGDQRAVSLAAASEYREAQPRWS